MLKTQLRYQLQSVYKTRILGNAESWLESLFVVIHMIYETNLFFFRIISEYAIEP